MNKKILIALTLFLVVASSAVGIYYVIQQDKTKQEPLTPVSQKNINYREIENIDKHKAENNPRVPGYDLPLKSSDLVNLKEIKKILNISTAAMTMLEKNGFVAVPNIKLKGADDEKVSTNFVDYYSFIYDEATIDAEYDSEWNVKSGIKHLPIFVTSDSILHYFHLLFNTTLIKLETKYFYDYIWNISKELYSQSLDEYNRAKDPIIKEAARRNVGYFSVPLILLGSENNITNIYDSVFYKETYSRHALAQCKSCISGLKESEYSSIYDCLEIPLGYYEEIEEENGDKIILNCFEEKGLKSKKDIVKMKEIQTCCQKNVIEYLQSNYPMENIVDLTGKYSFTPPDFVKKDVEAELLKIKSHSGFSPSALFVYKEDYSQYKPRGHYTKSEKLKKYFMAMMWYGRMTMLSKGDLNIQRGTSFCNLNGIISDYDAKVQTAQSSLINYYLAKDASIENRIEKITNVLNFLVGGADDLGPKEYLPVVKKNISSQSDISKKINDLQKEFLSINYNPKIYSGLGGCELNNTGDKLEEQAQAMLLNTKGFRLFGQKFVPDSYWMSKLVFPYSGEYTGPEKKPFTWVKTVSMEKGGRGFPRGLDIASILGSTRADEIIKTSGDADYTNYTKILDVYKKEVKSYNEDFWYKTVYNSWLYALSSLFNNFVKGYPTFMLTKAYQDKSLSTALASWAQLRHDTLLYVKQSYTMAEYGGSIEPVVVGYIEPLPELYIRLYKTALIFKNNLSTMLSEEEMPQGFDHLIDILDKIIVISNKELRHEVLEEYEYNFIDSFAETSERLIERLVRDENGGDIVNGVDEIINPIIIADVHTDGNTETVLEQGVGKIRTGLFVYRAPQNNNLVLGIGPIFSYFEFKKPISERMTDEEWRYDLFNNNYPSRPEWVSNFYTQY